MKKVDYCVSLVLVDGQTITVAFRWRILRAVLVWLLIHQNFQKKYHIEKWRNIHSF